MKKIRLLMPLGFLGIIAAFSAVVMLLWNWLMPSIFGLISINFWQALGLIALARILFGGFGLGKWRMMMAGRMHSHGMNPIHEKWMQMSPEQRERFIDKRRRFGFGHPFGRDRFFMENQDEHGNKNE